MSGRWPHCCCFLAVAFRTCLILHAAFLCNCSQVFFSIRLVSVHVVHPYNSIDTSTAFKKLGFILSVRYDFHMTDRLSIATHAFASPFWCLSRSMSHCFLDRWTCPQVSKHTLYCGDVIILIKAHVFRLVCVHMESYASSCSFQTMLLGFGLGGCICQMRFVIDVVRVGNCLCRVFSASLLC